VYMMRFFHQFVGLLLLFSTLNVTAQVTGGDSLATNYALTDNAWHFRAGDSTGWNNPRYDARLWTTINPETDLNENLDLWKKGRGWFIKRFRFRDLRNQDAAITIQQFGRSEVYLDGRRIAVLKPDGYDSGGSQRITTLVPIRIADSNWHTLAVRYAFRADPQLSAVVDKAPFQTEFGLMQKAMPRLLDRQRTSSGMGYLITGLFGLLGILHWLFYRANPAQRVNRVLAATMLTFSVGFLFNETNDSTGTLTLDSLCGALSRAGISIATVLLLLSVNTYVGRRPGWTFWSLAGLSIVAMLYSIGIGPVPYDLYWVPACLILVEYVRVSWLAKRRNPDADARLPWNSLKITLYALFAMLLLGVAVGISLSVFSLNYDVLEWIEIPLKILVLVAMFSVPLGLSLSLVRDYARTYQSLRQKYDEVEQLSAQTLRQEQEKQQLLASQNERLEQQVADRTAELEQSLADLHETQNQLIQREKLASLGELMAGIAHEIQNPLNFVNNFSEVSTELVTEIEEEQHRPDRDEALETELLGDLKQNLQKITHHGHRASSIVKGMLEHSRKSTGTKEPTNLNALCDEYFRLAYHGFRAQEKHGSTGRFNCELKMNLDPTIGEVNLIQQDMSRVLLNLINNGFYAVQQRQKTDKTGYQPFVSITTKRLDDRVEIRISDNGTGIPDSLKQKIFQPFFTTKPTGEGTGLGLSLSYDIVTKGHGGEMMVESTEGEGTEFIIRLPR
jgi:two-component system NtrC family sensor kinase